MKPEKAPNCTGDEIVEMSAAKRVSTSRRSKRQRLSVDYSGENLNSSRNRSAEVDAVVPKKMENTGLGNIRDEESHDDVVSGSSHQQESLNSVSCESAPVSQDDLVVVRKRFHRDFSGEDLTSRLSDELILLIFRCLSKKTLVQCAHVCKRWRRIAYDDTLWSRLDLSNRVLMPGNLGHVLERGVSALRLASADIREPGFHPSCSLTEVGVFCKLVYLDLSMTVITANDLAAMLVTTKSLLKLSLEHCTIIAESACAVAFNSDLEVLNLSMCYGLTDNEIKTVLAGCQRLLELNVAWTGLDATALDVLTTMAPSSLKRLNLSGCRKTLSDKHVQQLVSCCPNLLELDLSDCTNLTARCIDFITPLHSLEHVAFSRCYNISSSAYLFLVGLKSLLYLDVMGLFADQSLARLEHNLPKISVNKFMFSSIARPTVEPRRTSIWGLKVRQ